MMKRMNKLLCLLLTLILLLTACAPATQPASNTSNITTESSSKPTISAPKDRYYFVLINSERMSKEDLAAVDEICALYTDHDVFILDVKDCSNATAVYERMQQESATKQGALDGVQIMGSVDMVPSFSVAYKIKLPEDYSTDDDFYSDYFYSNFDNEATSLENFNIADNFASDTPLSLVPRWRVARLLLIRGQFADYLENYKLYLSKTQTEKPQIVSFSSSIFRYYNTTSVDDMAYFLQRAENEWNILESPRIYTNQQGAYLSPVTALGDITTQNMALENQRAVSEFFLLGHGSKTSMIRSVFQENGSQTQSNYLTSDQLYGTFRSNPYFLNVHACNTAQGMNAGFVRTALANGCVGAFATTSLMCNNGINCMASLQEMQSTSNFFAFYYAYLNGLHTGLSRSQAFFAAQTEWEAILSACAQQEINYTANYQFGYHNLLCYHNFGIFEPDVTSD